MKAQLTTIFAFLTISLLAQTNNDIIGDVYNFGPRRMSINNYNSGLDRLTKFYSLVYDNPSEYKDILRRELNAKNKSSYFYFDACKLLLDISNDKKDFLLVANNLEKIRVREIQSGMYFGLLFKLSLRGVNVIEPALNILNDRGFTLYLPKTEYVVSSAEALKFILPKYNSNLYIDKLIERYICLEDIEQKMNCLDLFVHACCPKADKFLENVLASNTEPKEIYKYAKKLRKKYLRRRNGNPNPKKFKEVFAERKVKLGSVTYEVLNRLKENTLKLRKWY